MVSSSGCLPRPFRPGAPEGRTRSTILDILVEKISFGRVTAVAVSTVTERAAVRARAAGKRLSGRLARKRSGWFYVWTRTVITRLDMRSWHRPVPVGLDSVTLAELPTRVPGATYRELEPPSRDVLPPPDWVWPATFPTVQKVYRTPAHREGRGVVEIPGGVVYGFKGYIGPDVGGVLTDASSLWSPEERTVLTGSAAALGFGVEELDGTTMTVWAGNAWGNYAHGLLQGVPRLDLLRRGFGLEADRYLLEEKSAPVIFEALDILGIPHERRHLVPRDHAPAYRCATLRAATAPPFTDAWPTAFLHELFLPDPPTTAPSRRIYTRREGPRRSVVNEAEVIALLESVGFEIVALEGRPVREQAAMFADAEVIVSAHGASLANLVFARAGARVIELMGKNVASAVYAEVSWLHGLQYEMIMGIEPAPPDRWWTWQMLADTIVDVPALRTSLERHGFA
jgi:hypothetical protein